MVVVIENQVRMKEEGLHLEMTTVSKKDCFVRKQGYVVNGFS